MMKMLLAGRTVVHDIGRHVNNAIFMNLVLLAANRNGIFKIVTYTNSWDY